MPLSQCMPNSWYSVLLWKAEKPLNLFYNCYATLVILFKHLAGILQLGSTYSSLCCQTIDMNTETWLFHHTLEMKNDSR